MSALASVDTGKQRKKMSLDYHVCGLGAEAAVPRAGGEHVPDNYTTRDDPATPATVRPLRARGRCQNSPQPQVKQSLSPDPLQAPRKSLRCIREHAVISAVLLHFAFKHLLFVLSSHQHHHNDFRDKRETARM